jgi:hypothetical protein
METAIVIVALIVYVAFRNLLAHKRRELIHRERMLALEKGVVLPPAEQELRRTNINVQRILLLSGLIWLALGIATFVTLFAVQNAGSSQFADDLPRGIHLVGIAPIGIGIAHLIVLLVGKNKAS